MDHPATEHYGDKMLAMLQAVWGRGFLSPGGAEEIARLIADADLTGASLLDIGSGAGGAALTLIKTHGAGYVTGMDVEDTVITHARALVAAEDLTSRIGFVKAAPGPLPFPPETFDVVFSKDSLVHIPDKRPLMLEVFRVLKPGGRFIASDWLISHDGLPSAEMAAYIAAEDLDFGMTSPARFAEAMRSAGFENVSTTSRNEWYRQVAVTELARMQGEVGRAAAQQVGQAFVDHNIKIWAMMIPVLNSGEHCPTHLRATKPRT
jgi:ubiquinone/menaquinone biosynthesis C-methylase UbiE